MEEPEVTPAGGNIFADLGLPDAEERLRKSKLVGAIQREMETQGLNQVKAAKLMGVSRPDLNQLLGGKYARFSIERMADMLNKLGLDVEMTIKPRTGEKAEFRILRAS
ncbi:MAG TPA: helix-turn-helix transcriptional regulator [Fimbriimonas sp.]|nr:helix-turn-helix transcriptional regulator [Fimbriimonas sp.]